jgi:hypothetical protein
MVMMTARFALSKANHTRQRCGFLGIMGLGAIMLLAGCERFRHETYTCPHNAIGLHELIINDNKAGADVTVVEYEKEYGIPIGSITDDQMMASNQDMVLILNRQTGRLNITMGTRTLFMTCEKAVFTM